MPLSPPPSFPAPLAELFTRDAASIPLVPQSPHSRELTSTINALAKQHKWDDALTSSIHLLNDDVGKAHDIVTDREDDEGCCLVHAILHRREGDYWNSKYWYSRISHPFLASFYPGRSSAKAFVDQVEAVVKGKSGGSSACGAKNLLQNVKDRQEAELKGLVIELWGERAQ